MSDAVVAGFTFPTHRHTQRHKRQRTHYMYTTANPRVTASLRRVGRLGLCGKGVEGSGCRAGMG